MQLRNVNFAGLFAIGAHLALSVTAGDQRLPQAPRQAKVMAWPDSGDAFQKIAMNV